MGLATVHHYASAEHGRANVACIVVLFKPEMPDKQPGDVTSKGLKIGTVARGLGISTSTIRAWEKIGLARSVRMENNYRMYTEDDVRMLRRALHLRRALGHNAPAIVHQLRQEGLLNSSPVSNSSPRSRLRKLRLQRRESLKQVPSAVNISIGVLSRLERSQATASIALMRKLAQYYGLNILDFFNPLDAHGPLVRPRDRKTLEAGPGVRMELLAAGKIVLEPHLFRVAPGAGSGESYSFARRRRVSVYYSRKASYYPRGPRVPTPLQRYFCFPSATQHRWLNPGRSETVILWINTPPTF